MIILCSDDMVKLSNGESVFGGYISINGEMVKRWNATCALGLVLSLEWISPPCRFPRGYLPVQPLETISCSGKHLKNSRYTHCHGRCLRIGWYFCTWNDTYLISLYEKGCICYGMFLYICSQYVAEDCPVMSWWTLVMCGTFTDYINVHTRVSPS